MKKEGGDGEDLSRGTRLAVKEGVGPARQPERWGGARGGELGRLLHCGPQREERRGDALAGREWGEGVWAFEPGRGGGKGFVFFFLFSLLLFQSHFQKQI